MQRQTSTLRLVGRPALPQVMPTWHLILPLPELMIVTAIGIVLALA